MKVLIAGAAGFIGRHLAWRIEGKHDVHLTDAIVPDPDRVPSVYTNHGITRIPEFTPKPSPVLPFTQGDITDFNFCKRVSDGMDAVVLLAASVDYKDATTCFSTNTVSTFNMLEACAQNGVKRVLVASSINASGLFYCRITERPRNWAYLPIDEDIPTDHEDAYSLSKFCNELNCVAWTNRTGLTTAAFRFSAVFAPEFTAIWKERVAPVTQWPETLAQYVDLRDVVTGLQQALECESLPKSGVYQLTSADTLLLEPTMETIERFRPDLLKVLRKELPGHTSMMSHERANKAFGYNPIYTWRN